MPDEQDAQAAPIQEAGLGPDVPQQAPTQETFTEAQVLQILSKAKENFSAELSRHTGTLGSKIQTLQSALDRVEEWKGLADEERATFTDAAALALEHAEVLADKFSLSEKQRQIVARGRTRQERVEMAEAMSEGKAPADTVPNKDTLAGLLEEMGVRPRNGTTREPMLNSGGVMPPQLSDQDFVKASADDPDAWDPKRAQAVLRSIGIK